MLEVVPKGASGLGVDVKSGVSIPKGTVLGAYGGCLGTTVSALCSSPRASGYPAPTQVPGISPIAVLASHGARLQVTSSCNLLDVGPHQARSLGPSLPSTSLDRLSRPASVPSPGPPQSRLPSASPLLRTPFTGRPDPFPRPVRSALPARHAPHSLAAPIRSPGPPDRLSRPATRPIDWPPRSVPPARPISSPGPPRTPFTGRPDRLSRPARSPLPARLAPHSLAAPIASPGPTRSVPAACLAPHSLPASIASPGPTRSPLPARLAPHSLVASIPSPGPTRSPLPPDPIACPGPPRFPLPTRLTSFTARPFPRSAPIASPGPPRSPLPARLHPPPCLPALYASSLPDLPCSPSPFLRPA